jgi:hypothetical protein
VSRIDDRDRDVGENIDARSPPPSAAVFCSKSPWRLTTEFTTAMARSAEPMIGSSG